jgi:hypothetical protein
VSGAAGWAFLVARGTRKGYRAVLAPDFLVTNRRHDLLTERVGGTASDASTTIEHIADEAVGDLTVTYRVEQARADELAEAQNHDGQDVLLDQHGRPLELLYGLVTTAPVTVGRDDLRRARAEAVDSYRQFLADEDSADVQSSAAFRLSEAVPVRAVAKTPPTPATTSSARLPMHAPEEPRHLARGGMVPSRSSRRHTRLGPALLAGVLAFLIIVWLAVDLLWSYM